MQNEYASVSDFVSLSEMMSNTVNNIFYTDEAWQ
jgi:hypothetical protein